eukprot:m.356440 g.356440  ORF g.356440 m.356440 type:complete len:275 (+) comp17543_c0_seq1:84-908(+)
MSEAAAADTPKHRAAKLELDYVSWIGDLANGLSIMAFVFLIIAIASPSWIIQNLSDVPLVSPLGNAYTAQVSVGRGLFQNYMIMDKRFDLYTVYATDQDGYDWDAFCGNISAAPVFPVTNTALNKTATGYGGRYYNTANYCPRRKTTAGVALLTLLFAVAALVSTQCAQRGSCGQLPFIICVACMVITTMVVCANMGRFILKERKDLEVTALSDRFFPYETTTKPGYSLILFVFCIFLYIITMLLAGCEMCCGREDDDKFDNSEDVERLKSSSA